MQNLKQAVFSLLVISAVLVACDKDDDPDTNIVSRNGIEMRAANEVQTPAVVSSATGSANVSYNKARKMLSYTITWQNLSDSLTGAHIHGVASRTQNAPVRDPIPVPRTFSGTFTDSVLVEGVAIKEDSLLKGFYYFNIHSKKYPAGEIRGQIEF